MKSQPSENVGNASLKRGNLVIRQECLKKSYSGNLSLPIKPRNDELKKPRAVILIR